MASKLWPKPVRIGTRLLSRGLATLGLLVLFSAVALAANPAAVQFYYIPVPEDQALTSMKAASTDATPPVWTYISIAVGTNGTFVYYDQWENGYDVDIANPVNLYSAGNPGGTQVWGNGLASDGCAPNKNGKTPLPCTDANDTLTSGNVIVLANAVNPATLQSVIDYDGGDKIGSTQQVAVSRIYWPDRPRTLLAGAVELYPTSEWGVLYQSPVGENNDYNSTFQYTSMAIQATLNGTQVTVDANGPLPGGAVTNATLSQGQSLVVNNIDEAATASSNFPIQVNLLTADRDSSYEYSDYTLSPKEGSGSRYYSPVGVTKANPNTQTQITLFNGEADLLTVRCEFRNGVTQDFQVGPFTSAFLAVPDRSGAGCVTVDPPGAPFFAISLVDSAELQGGGGQTWDWGFTLLPEEFLSPQALVGLGLGRYPTSSTSPNQNGSPIFVTPVCAGSATSTYVYADINGDGAPDNVDLNGDNDTNDTVDGISEATSAAGMLVTQLQSVRLFDPVDRDQTGMRINSRQGPNNTGDPGCDIIAVWGEDPNVASSGEPGFDVGTSVPPLRSFTGLKTAEVSEDADQNGYLTPGDAITYTIESQNTGIAPIPTMTLTDTVPNGTTYVLNSTYADGGMGWVPVPDDGTGTPFPLDGAGLTGTNMPVGATWRVRFNVTVNPLPEGVCNLVITNTGYINGQGKDYDVQVVSIVQCTAQIVIEKVAHGPNPPPFEYDAQAFFEVEPPPGSPANELPANFSLQPPANGALAVTYTVPTGVYTVTEALTDGWTLYDIQCEGGGVPYLEGRQVVVNVFGPATIKCTFFNAIPGKLIVEKVTQPTTAQQLFDFEGGALPTEDYITGTLSGGQSVTYTVIPGLFFVAETVPQGWTLINTSCVDPTNNSFPAPDPDPGEILAGNKGGAIYNVAPAETVKCTWTNSLNGVIILEKLTAPPATPGLFTFTGAFTSTLSHGETITRSVSPGTYTTTETVPTGWSLSGVTCDDTDSVQSGNSAIYKVASGETVKCTFTNDLHGKLVVKKKTIPAGDTTRFNFSGAIVGAISDGQALTRSLPSGIYSVTETIPPEWTLVNIVCTDPEFGVNGPTATVFVPLGQTITCTYTNEPKSRLGDFVWNDLNKDGIQDPGEPGIVNVQVQLFSVTAPTTAVAADTQVGVTTTDFFGHYAFAGLVAGTYYIVVAVPEGFTVSPQQQGSDPARDSVIDPTGRSINVVLPAATVDLDVDAGMFQTPTADNPSIEPGAGGTIFLPAVRDSE